MNNTKNHTSGVLLGLFALHCSVCLLIPFLLIGGVGIAAILNLLLSPIFLLPAALLTTLILLWATRRNMSQPKILMIAIAIIIYSIKRAGGFQQSTTPKGL